MPRQATLCGAAGFLPLICQPWSRVEAKALLGLRFILSGIRHLLRLVSPALDLEPLCSYPALFLGLYVSFQAPGVSSVVRFEHFNVVRDYAYDVYYRQLFHSACSSLATRLLVSFLSDGICLLCYA